MMEEQIRREKAEQVYDPDRYLNDKEQLISDFNNLDEVYRDVSRISMLYPNNLFIFDERFDKIERIIWRRNKYEIRNRIRP